MGYYTQERAKRGDQLEAELITRHLWDWVNRHGGKSHGQGRKNSDNPELMAIDLLACRMGCDRSVIEQVLRGKSACLTFDKADRILCAIGRPELWVTDPELHEVYESLVRGADSSSPIVEFAA